MATETRYMFSDEDLTANANQVKEIVVDYMMAHGYLTEEAALTFMEHHAVVIAKKGILGGCIDRMIGFKDKDDRKYQIIRIGEEVKPPALPETSPT